MLEVLELAQQLVVAAAEVADSDDLVVEEMVDAAILVDIVLVEKVWDAAVVMVQEVAIAVILAV